jgi:Domain of unknown function (DUF5916)/PDZ domain/Serine aminopeptidase, S33
MKRSSGFLVLLLALSAAAQAPRKQIQAVRADAMRLDGRLDEAVWQSAPVMTGFVQRRPDEGAAATDRTEVRFAYDDGALWIGARMHAAEAGKIAAPVTRRDNVSQSEHLLVSLDTFLDRRTAYTFGVTAAGTRVDRYHPSDFESVVETFDPVWEAAVDRDASGWTAEMRIPFSQLRFTATGAQTWGVNVVRIIPTKNESDYWIVVPRQEVGWASRFGDLTGLEVRPSRRVEVLPYASAGTATDYNAGADIKAGIGPNLTLDAAINPDFGQVEADPAVVNLSAFETIYPERRPFFIEGAQLLRGGGQNYFYSRRIGAADARILGAAKLTGRLASGMSVGALVAATDRNDDVAPRTFFGVFRGQQQFGKSGSTVGLTFTGVDRSLSDDRLAGFLTDRAFAGGADWTLRFLGGQYEVGGYAGASRVDGTAAALARVQRSSARYYQRPDADHVDFDPTRTSLSGYTAGVRAERLGGRHWLWFTSIDATSPGFEINDAGRISSADVVFAYGQLRYRETEPRGVLRDYEVALATENGFNFGGTRTWNALRTDSFITWKNFWGTSITAWMDLPAYSDRATRGGPLMGTARAWVLQGQLYNSRSARNTWLLRAYRGESEFGERTWEVRRHACGAPEPALAALGRAALLPADRSAAVHRARRRPLPLLVHRSRRDRAAAPRELCADAGSHVRDVRRAVRGERPLSRLRPADRAARTHAGPRRGRPRPRLQRPLVPQQRRAALGVAPGQHDVRRLAAGPQRSPRRLHRPFLRPRPDAQRVRRQHPDDQGELLDPAMNQWAVGSWQMAEEQPRAPLPTACRRVPTLPKDPAMKTLIAVAILLFAFSSRADLPRRGAAGLAVATENNRAVVRDVFPGTAAEKAGLAKGDAILSIDGERVATASDVTSRLAKRKVGDQVRVEYQRGEEARFLTLVMQAWPMETSSEYDVTYGEVSADGNRYRTIATKPKGNGPFPTVFIVQGVGCGSVDNPPPGHSYRSFVQSLTKRGLATFRVDKPGSGDSEGGPCPSASFDTEVNAYRAGLATLKGNVFLFGHSMGGVMAPLIAKKGTARGIIIYGSVSRSWSAYTLDNVRRQMRLRGAPFEEIAEEEKASERFNTMFYVEKQPLEKIVAAHPEYRERFPDGKTYAAGKDGKYFQDLYAHGLVGAWKATDAALLAVWGASDFLTDGSEHEWIAAAVNSWRPGTARYVKLDGIDHWMRKAPDQAASVNGGPEGAEYDDRLAELIEKFVKEKSK